MFPREDMEEDKYFDIIPITWTSCNNRRPTFASTSFLYEMMVISFLNYQADEFMEAVVGTKLSENLLGLRELIHDLFLDGPLKLANDGLTRSPPGHRDEGNNFSPAANGNNGSDKPFPNGLNGSANPSEVYDPLSRFISHILGHPAVTDASSWDRSNMQRELQTFLLAHVTQTEDNLRFRGQQRKGTYSLATDTFFHWVRTTSADHTSCPYAFAFVCCLLSSSLAEGGECFPTAAEKYFAAAACQHLATMCRMYNDYGSVARDASEENLNSVNFPEFGAQNAATPGAVPEDSDAAATHGIEKKNVLFELAEYERSCLYEALQRLEAESKGRGADHPTAKKLQKRKMAIWRMFCDVTDLYGQIYVVRDIASRMVHDSGKRESDA